MTRCKAVKSVKWCSLLWVWWKGLILQDWNMRYLSPFYFPLTSTFACNISEYQNGYLVNPQDVQDQMLLLALVICLKLLSLIKYSYIYTLFESKYPRRDNLMLTFENCPFFTLEVKENYFIINWSVVEDEFWS